MLQCVTFTGADDRTNPASLVELSGLYPWIEWGILIGTRQGVSRMPSKEWISAILAAKNAAGHEVNLSLHVCGNPLRAIADGRTIIGEGGGDIIGFDRVQLNWHGERQEEIGSAIARSFHGSFLEFGWEPEVIFQGDEVNAGAGLHRATQAAGFPVSMLFDSSHGNGILPANWPDALPDIKCGYAGRLGPDNVLVQLPKIRVAHAARGTRHRFWIDMETAVRTDEVFDLAKCRGVCELVKGEIWQEEAP